MLEAIRKVMLCSLIILSGCIPLNPFSASISDQIEVQRVNNPMGCGFILGGGNPPASRVDGGASFGWGEHMTVASMNECLGSLKTMK